MVIEVIVCIYNELFFNFFIEGFVFVDVFIKKSLVILEDDYGVEVLISLEFVDVQILVWVIFFISFVGRESEEWMEYCIGRIKVVFEGLDDFVEKIVVVFII